jgi:hypothetical protein
MQLTNAQQHYVQTSYTKFQPNQTIHVESVEQTSLMPQTWQLSQNSQSLSQFYWTAPVPNLIQIRKNVENIGKMHLHLQVNCSFHCTNFQETQN